jgi:hypothetical protein
MLQFNDMGFLMPIKPIESNLAEFQATFVINEQRERLFSVYLEFLEELKKLEIGHYFQRIDGSFTTRKMLPSDIDLVTFIDFKAYKLQKSRFLDMKARYKNRGIDAYFAEIYPKNHALFSTNDYQFNDWMDVYGATKPIGLQRKVFKKGFILINF